MKCHEQKNSSERKEPSTYERLLALPEGELELLKEKIFFICIADQEEADAVENKAVMTKELFEQITEHTVALGLIALTLALTEEHTELCRELFQEQGSLPQPPEDYEPKSFEEILARFNQEQDLRDAEEQHYLDFLKNKLKQID